MSLEGELKVKLDCIGRRVEAVHIESARPVAVARLLRGRSPEEVLAIVARLFSLCGCAQGVAARRALSSAGAAVDGEADETAGVVLEIVHEYFWRLLIDWPRIVRQPIDVAAVAEVRRLRTSSPHGPKTGARDNAGPRADTFAALAAMATRHVFGMPPARWLVFADLDALEVWIARGPTLPARLLGALLRDAADLGRSDVALMPAATRETLTASVLPAMDGDFERAPTWNGKPVETGALARARSHPLVAALIARDGNTVAARMLARLYELALLLRECASPNVDFAWVDGFRWGEGEGVGVVQTARGLLVHRARLQSGRIADYRIVAPTEWNFHPAGALARGLRGLVADDPAELERNARLAVQGLDPCVACGIEVGHA